MAHVEIGDVVLVEEAGVEVRRDKPPAGVTRSASHNATEPAPQPTSKHCHPSLTPNSAR